MNEMLNVVVDGLWCQGDRSLAVRLVSASGEPLPGWEPGAHIDVHLPCGLIRQYSLTGDNRAGSYLICVAQERASRGGSRYIHQTLRPGQRLLISAPRNLFALRDDGPVLLLAAGIGITPLYAMLLQREATGRPFVLHYFVKRREEAAFMRELSRPLKHGICVVHCSAEGESPRQWLATLLPAPGDEQRIYTCGPEGFMAAVRDAALKKGWAETHIHSEAFAPVAPAAIAQDAATFTITLASSGEKWPVPANKSIAQVLQDNGVAVPLSCEMGICGACLTPVVDGVVDHRDTVQSAAEKSAAAQHIALCCSRSHSGELVIDL